MDTGLKHTLKEEFVVCYVDSDKTRHYANYISNGVNTTENIDNAMKFNNLEEVKALKVICMSRSSYFTKEKTKIVRVATIVEDIDDTYSAESE